MKSSRSVIQKENKNSFTPLWKKLFNGFRYEKKSDIHVNNEDWPLFFQDRQLFKSTYAVCFSSDPFFY